MQEQAYMEKVASMQEIVAALSRPTISPDKLHQLGVLPASRNGIYDACARGEIECFRVGRKIAIICAPLRRKLGLDTGEAA
jgi:hypothetical protein